MGETKKKKKVTNSNSVKEDLQRAQQDKSASQWMDGRMFVDVNICKDLVISPQFSACLTLNIQFLPISGVP